MNWRNKMKKKIDVVAAIIKKDDKYFCARRPLGKSAGGKWEFPGGKVDPGETREQALVREIEEEFESKIKVNDYIITTRQELEDRVLELHSYTCELVSGDLLLKEHMDSKWLTRDELKSLDWATLDIEVTEKIVENNI